jgi:thioredoxin reductase
VSISAGTVPGTKLEMIGAEVVLAENCVSPQERLLQIETVENDMNNVCDVAIVGAGPYGLSVAAHLRARGVDFRIFGKALETWRSHMPRNMVLKSDGFASNLSAPSAGSTLKAYCAKRGLPYADQGLPIPLALFVEYADWFQKRHVPTLEQQEVCRVERNGNRFVLTLENGELATARNVVLAVGISWFAHTPAVLAALPRGLLSHSYDHRDVSQFEGRDVAVIGRGASATDLAALLSESGARPCIVARTPTLEFNSVPDPQAETLLYRLQRPASGIGRGWSSYFCASAPQLFYRLPAGLKQRAIQSHMHPAAGWFMRERVEGRIPMLLGRTIASARSHGGGVELTLNDSAGREEMLFVDHVVAATGYHADMRRLTFLAPDLRNSIASRGQTALLSDNFETPVRGLFAVGLATMDSFGPLLRFMAGAEFAAPRLAAHLDRDKAVAHYRHVA